MNQVQLIRNIDSVLTPLYLVFPFSHYGLATRTIPKSTRTILDVGCADGSFMRVLNRNGEFEVTGVDIFEPYLKKARKTGVYKRLVKSDVRRLPFKKEKFDVVFCSQVIEHLTRKEGFELIKSLEKLAKKRVVFMTPVGDLPQDPYDGNPYQRHKSQWLPRDFQDKGYKVKGQGFKFLYGSGNAVKRFGLLSYIFSVLSLLGGPILTMKPEWAVYIFCWKNLN